MLLMLFHSLAVIDSFLYFFNSLLKFSLCSSILLLSSVSTFMTIILNSLPDKLLIFISLRFFFPNVLFFLLFGAYFVSSFCLILCVCFYILGKTATSISLEVVTLCRWWSFSFNPDLALCCLLNLFGCIYCRIYSWFAPAVQHVPRPVSVPKKGIQWSPSFRLIGCQTLRQKLLKFANIYSPEGLQL